MYTHKIIATPARAIDVAPKVIAASLYKFTANANSSFTFSITNLYEQILADILRIMLLSYYMGIGFC